MAQKNEENKKIITTLLRQNVQKQNANTNWLLLITSFIWLYLTYSRCST